jgi:formylglycine-generating enzyme required for sulfatase activity
VRISDLGAMITIPAGEFQYQDAKVRIPAFAISKYEVTIAEYAKFLKFLEANPNKAKDFDHPKQSKGKSHIPTGWADMKELNPPNPGYYTRVKKWGQFNGAPITLDSPVFGVDWYDAYAYANWIGQRLPTEQEWEKAARGTGSGKFPWGEENKPERANTGIDFTPNPDPKVGGEKDGFKRWSPVNAPKSDRSEYGVFGMAGNVSEWTASFAEDPQLPGDKVPVIRGGNWKTNDASITRRVMKLSELQSDEGLGFRTAKDIK